MSLQGWVKPYPLTFLNSQSQAIPRQAIVKVDAATDYGCRLIATIATDIPLGVAAMPSPYDKRTLAPVNGGFEIIVAGIAPVFASGAITRGAVVGADSTTFTGSNYTTLNPAGTLSDPETGVALTGALFAGYGLSMTRATAGAQPAPALGVALNSTANLGDTCWVLLSFNARF